ncbi:MAG: NTP transferase domain-containing protein, partial [Terriglobales bacterium]
MDTLRDITTVVLCGGQGTRLRAITSRDTDSQENVPKPLIEIGGKPILWHILQLYAAQGCRRFVLCLGYRGDLIRQTLPLEPAWDVTFAETGELTPTGGRVGALA